MLFVAWQDARSRRWFPVGRLWREDGEYRFGYIEGFREAEKEAGFMPLLPFPRVDEIYHSSKLFPSFGNRIMNPSRVELSDYLDRLGLAPGGDLEELGFDILARGQGRRATDSLELFPHPLVSTEEGSKYRLELFVHGLRHQPESARARAEALEVGEQIYLMPDPQNPHDRHAVALRSEDRHVLGYLPRYHGRDVGALLASEAEVAVEVLRVNPSPAPPGHRLLVRVEADWPFDRSPLDAEIYALVASARSRAS